MAMESKKYVMPLQTFADSMPDEKGRILLSRLVLSIDIAYSIREIARKKQICEIVDKIYNTYSELKEYLIE